MSNKMSEPNKDKPKSPLGSKVVISTSMMREQKDNIKRTPQEQEEYERFMKQQAEYRERWKHFCCLCGKEDYHHHSSRHAFFPCLDEYRCKNCGKFFYQHDHTSNPCFEPYKRLGI